MPVGPSTPVYKNGGLDTTNSVEYTPVAADQLMSAFFNCGYAQKVTANGPGNLFIKRAGDAAFVKYVVVAGQSVTGDIVAVGGTTTGTTVTDVVCEM